MDADERILLAHLEMGSRFSVSSEEATTSSHAGPEEQHVTPDHLSGLEEGDHNKVQLPKAPNSENDHPKAFARSSILRHPSRRKGLVFTPSALVTLETSTQDLGSTNGEDLASESSEDFDITIQPDYNKVNPDHSAICCGNDTGMRGREYTIRAPVSPCEPSPMDSATPCNDEACYFTLVPWPVTGQVTSEQDPTPTRPTPVVFVGSQPHSPVESSRLLQFDHVGLALLPRRKPVPKLEDYDELFPPQASASTVATDNLGAEEPSFTLLPSVSIDTRLAIPNPEAERDTMRSSFRVPRFGTPNLRESSPLRKFFLPFARGLRQALSTPNSRAVSRSPSRPLPGAPFPLLGSPPSLGPSSVSPGRNRTSSSPSQTLPFPIEPSYDYRYLSPISLRHKGRHLNPTSSAPNVAMSPALEETCSGIPPTKDVNLTQFSGFTTPSTPGSIPFTPSPSGIPSHDTTDVPLGPSPRGSPRCSTPLHASGSARSLRSIASKIIALPTFMRRSSSSQTVTRISISQTKTISDDFSQATTTTPCVLRSPWMGDSNFDGIASPDPPLGTPFEYSPDPRRGDSQICHPSLNSLRSSRIPSPLPPAFFHSIPSSSYVSTSLSTALQLPPVDFECALPSSLGLPQVASQTARQAVVRQLSSCNPTAIKARPRVRPNSGVHIDPTAEEIESILTSKIRGQSEGVYHRHSKGRDSIAAAKHKGSPGRVLGAPTGLSTKEPAIYYDSNERGDNAFLMKGIKPGEHDRFGKGETMLEGPWNRVWPTKNDSWLGGHSPRPQGISNIVAYPASSSGTEHIPQSNRRGDSDQLEIEIAMTSRFVELLSAEHVKEYKHIQAMIDEVYADIAGVTMTPEGGSSDGEGSVIESYMQHDADEATVMNDDGYDSDYSLNSHTRTLRPREVAVVQDEKNEVAPGGIVGYWFGVPKPER